MPHLFATLHEVSKWRWNICRQRLLARQGNEPGEPGEQPGTEPL